MSNNKQSSVEWFFSELERMQYFIGNDMLEAFKEAKAMHKEEVLIAYSKASPITDGVFTAIDKAHDYYNETFGGNNDQQ